MMQCCSKRSHIHTTSENSGGPEENQPFSNLSTLSIPFTSPAHSSNYNFSSSLRAFLMNCETTQRRKQKLRMQTFHREWSLQSLLASLFLLSLISMMSLTGTPTNASASASEISGSKEATETTIKTDEEHWKPWTWTSAAINENENESVENNFKAKHEMTNENSVDEMTSSERCVMAVCSVWLAHNLI